MKQAIIVVDYQNDFVSGSLGFSKAVELETAICEKIQSYRAKGADVIFTFDTHSKDYLSTQEGRKLPVTHCIKGEPGWELFGEVASLRQKEDKTFEKGAFGSWELGEYMKLKQYQQVELCGVVSNICVVSNAVLVKAALPEAEIIVDRSCTASNDELLNQKALDVMGSLQITII